MTHNNKSIVNGKKSLNSRELLGTPELVDSTRSEVDESRVLEPGEDVMIDTNAVEKFVMRQGIVESSENNDRTYFERECLDAHAIMVVW